jgi:hypothetical protein
MPTVAEELEDLTTTVGEAVVELQTHLTVSANVTRNMIETQSIFLTHIKK